MAREKKAPAGAPGWMVTFADLMSLLLCFFVLLLSFSSMDQRRFFDAVGSMREAFGVTKEMLLSGVIELQGIPFMKQTRRLIPLPIPVAMLAEIAGEGEAVCDRPEDRVTRESQSSDLDAAAAAAQPGAVAPGAEPGDRLAASELEQLTRAGEDLSPEALPGDGRPPGGSQARNSTQQDPAQQDPEQQGRAQQNSTQQEVVRQLKASLSGGMVTAGVSVEDRDGAIRITLPAASTFPSGSDDLGPEMATTIDQVADVMARSSGRILVVGHTDDIPISTWRFRSNWELSSARAIAVLKRLAARPALDERRLVVMGHADTSPLVPNRTPEDRSRNRRVEIVLMPK
ncbi:MAG: OmpA family protein [Azospirillum sp.]|nr:OmpA family protein [Azospirillum sp.]